MGFWRSKLSPWYLHSKHLPAEQSSELDPSSLGFLFFNVDSRDQLGSLCLRGKTLTNQTFTQPSRVSHPLPDGVCPSSQSQGAAASAALGARPRNVLFKLAPLPDSELCILASTSQGGWGRREHPIAHLQSQPYPITGCNTMARGSSRSSDTRIFREVPLRRVTSIRSVPVSVQ